MVGLGRELTQKEKKTLVAIIRYPTKTDKEICDEIGLNLSTVTAIRRRLLAARYYFTVRAPMVQYLGAELLTIAYGELSNTIPKEKKNEFCNKFAKEHNRIFLCFTSDDFGVIMSVSKNYTDVKHDIDQLQYFLSQNDMLTSSPWQYVMFPFEVSSLVNFFDCSYVISQYLTQEHLKSPDLDLKYKRYEMYNLTAKEKSALLGLVANPSTPDNAIAKKIGISRQAFSNIRQRFENDGLIRILNIPNIQLLGSEIVVFSHILFNPDALIEERRKGIKLVVEESPAVFIISGSFESVMLHYAQDYNDFNFLKNKFLSYYSTHNFLRSVGNITLLPVKSLKNHKSFDFSGALKELLV